MLTGTGKSFSPATTLGALVERRPETENEADGGAFERTVDRLEALRVPTIAALNGSVYGGATDLALACDFRIGVDGMRMHMPAARLGIIYYPSGIERYVSRLGIAAAKKLFLTAQPIEHGRIAPHRLSRRGGAERGTTGADRCARRGAGRQCAAGVAGLKQAINETAAGRARPRRAECGPRQMRRLRGSRRGAERLAEKRAPVFRGRCSPFAKPRDFGSAFAPRSAHPAAQIKGAPRCTNRKSS